MPRRTMAERKRRAAERQTRRDTLAVLLSRMQRGALLDAERPLLRAHVEAELSEADDLRRTVNGQQKVIQRQADQLEAAHQAIEEAEQAAEQHARNTETVARECESYRSAWKDEQAQRVKAEQAAADYRKQLHMYRAVEEQRNRIITAGTIPAARLSVAAHIAQHFPPTSTPEPRP